MDPIHIVPELSDFMEVNLSSGIPSSAVYIFHFRLSRLNFINPFLGKTAHRFPRWSKAIELQG